MDHAVQVAFDRVKAALEARRFSLAHVFVTIAEFVRTRPAVAFAMSSHAGDIVSERLDPMTGTELMVEIYRRTFFERVPAEKYGTQEILDAGNDMLVAFADYLVFGLTYDVQLAAGMPAWYDEGGRH